MTKKQTNVCAFLGENTETEGNLSFNGTARIDGAYKGEISAEGSLIIGQTADIESDIHTRNIVVGGKIRGTIRATEKIEISPSGRVYGDIQAPNLIIHPGAIFEGNCMIFQPNQMDNERLSIVNSNKSNKLEPIEDIKDEF
jgi:cytoskeletal protein CcmA (bactofilin family)